MNQNAEIILENCRVPKDNLASPLNGGSAYRSKISPGSRVKTATKALGVARAAYEEALAYANERVQGGKVIIRHQAVAEELVEMEMAIESTRALIYRTARMVDQGVSGVSRFEAMSKAKAAEVAAYVATAATEMHGANGISRDRRISKLMRDAITCMHIGISGHAAKDLLGQTLADRKHLTGQSL